MSTPLANKTTASSSYEMALPNGTTTTTSSKEHLLQLTNKITTGSSSIHPSGQLKFNPKTPHTVNSRFSSLANGFRTGPRDIRATQLPQPANHHHNNTSSTSSTSSTNATARTNATVSATATKGYMRNTLASSQLLRNNNRSNIAQSASTRLSKVPSMIASKNDTFEITSPKSSAAPNVGTVTKSTSSRVSSLVNRPAKVDSLSSRSPSVLSSISSFTSKKVSHPRPSAPATDVKSVKEHAMQKTKSMVDNNNRKLPQRFLNPIECQRQLVNITTKYNELSETSRSQEDKIEELQEQLKHAIDVGTGYATTVQYLASRLKLDAPVDLVEECELLKDEVGALKEEKRGFDDKLDEILADYKNHLQVELDLRKGIETELSNTIETHKQTISDLRDKHNTEIQDLTEKHSDIEAKLSERIDILETDLKAKCKELADLRQEYEILTNDFNKLKESLTKDKDARVKYAQEKVCQLQKDVESLNSILEMRLEKIHSLEKETILLAETQKELAFQERSNKTLSQQIESLNAALENKKTQFDELLAEHEKMKQDMMKRDG